MPPEEKRVLQVSEEIIWLSIKYF